MIAKSIGTVLCIEAACMLPSLLVAFIYQEATTVPFVVSILLTAVVGLALLSIKSPISRLYSRDGFAIVALGWIHISAFGALPFILSGAIPSVVDALFESVSGFSTTGASILKNYSVKQKTHTLRRK